MKDTNNMIPQAKIDTTVTKCMLAGQTAEKETQQSVIEPLKKMIAVWTELDRRLSMTEAVRKGECLTLTVQEMADLLGLSKPVAYDLINDGSIHSIRLGRKILIPRQAVIDFLSA